MIELDPDLPTAVVVRKMIAANVPRAEILAQLVASGRCKSRKNACSMYRYAYLPPGTWSRRARKYVRAKPGDVLLEIPVAPDVLDRLQVAADARDVAPGVLVTRIVSTVLSENMIDAVLDDAGSSENV